MKHYIVVTSDGREWLVSASNLRAALPRFNGSKITRAIPIKGAIVEQGNWWFGAVFHKEEQVFTSTLSPEDAQRLREGKLCGRILTSSKVLEENGHVISGDLVEKMAQELEEFENMESEK